VSDPEKAETTPVTAPGDAEAIRHFTRALLTGRHWYLALLEAMGLWTSAEEVRHDRIYRYLINGEAFDWLLLAERLCEEVNGLLPEEEKNSLIFSGKPPLQLSADEVKGIIGESKFRHYLNFFYGHTVEESLLLAVREEVGKERQALGLCPKEKSSDEAFRRIYNAEQPELLKLFRREKGYPQARSSSLGELKEFTYWLFKYRLSHCEKAKIASDTAKALRYLRQQWARKGYSGILAADEPGEKA